MKRLVIGAVALAAAAGVVAAHPVLADGTAPASDPRSASSVASLVNPVLGAVPAPAGWHQRSICFGDEQLGKAWCLYFPFPT